MKKSTKTLCMGLIALTAFASCGTRSAEDKATLEAVPDSAIIEDSMARASVYLTLPRSANQTLDNAIWEYADEQLGSSYEGKDRSFKALADHYAGVKADHLREMYPTGEVEWTRQLACEHRITVAYQTGLYLTLSNTGWEDFGGAHPNHFTNGVTLRKSDGRRMGWDAFTGDFRSKIQDEMKQGLCTYFQLDTPEKLKGYLLNESDAYYLPLPVCPPLFGEDGVRFQYQSYEIAPYAAGDPAFTVPYDKLKPFMSKALKDLVK